MIGLSSPATVLQMPPERFLEEWPRLQKELDLVRHMWEPWWTKEFIHASVVCGQWQVWGAGFDGAVRLTLFTQIVFYPAAKVLQGTLVLGNSLNICKDAIWAAMESFARENDCIRMEVLGRMGWSRMLRNYGFRTAGVVLSCPVNQTRVQ